MQTSLDISIHSSLSAELAALRTFVGLLEQEQLVLLENDSDALMRLAEQKSASALLLNQLVDKRTQSLRALLPDLKISTIANWLQQNQIAAVPVWDAICALAERALQINTTSGELINLKLQHNQQALALLSRANETANLYGPDGQRNLPSSSGKSIASA